MVALRLAGSLYKYFETQSRWIFSFRKGTQPRGLAVHEASGGRPEGLDDEATES